MVAMFEAMCCCIAFVSILLSARLGELRRVFGVFRGFRGFGFDVSNVHVESFGFGFGCLTGLEAW